MRVLIACERSGIVRDAFIRDGHDAWSCDLEPNRTGPHLQCDVLTIIDGGWDLMIAHPECRYLSVSGLHWNNRKRGWKETEKAVEFFMKLVNAPIPRIAIENPVCIMSTRWRKPDQQFQPYEFGDDASKRTCLWLKNLPPLWNNPSLRFPGRWVVWNGKLVERWSNQTDSGQNRLGPSETRSADRARTYPGPARAMATQWGSVIQPLR